MTFLIAGLTVWSCAHLMPSVMPGIKHAIIQRIGIGAYKSLFALVIVSSVLMIIFGWRSTAPEFIYHIDNPVIRGLLQLTVILALLLFFSAKYPNRLKRIIRHPQLTGVFIWALCHLTLNGDDRSVLLFGTMALWSALEMVFISKREGIWQKPVMAPIKTEMIGLGISLCVLLVVILSHQYLSGVTLF